MRRRGSSPGSRLALPLLGAALALALAGCGHPATKAECEELFAKNAELTLRTERKISDPKQIESLTAAARATEGEVFLSKCVGKRITTSALDCVRRATTPKQADACL